MTVLCLEGALVPNLIYSHTMSRVPGLTPSSVMGSESQGFQDKSCHFVQKGVGEKKQKNSFKSQFDLEKIVSLI